MLKKRKKVLALIILTVMSVVFCGYTKEYDDSQSKVYDDAALFTKDEKYELQRMCVDSAEGTKLDVAIATVNDAKGKSSMVYADDFYDNMGLGYDQGASGLILLIDMDNREIYISTAGIAIEYFNDDDIESVLSDMDSYMESEDYYGAAVTFIEDVNSHVAYINNSYYKNVKPWFDGDYTDYSEFEKEYHKSVFAKPWVDLLIAAVISAIIVLCMTFKSKSKMTANENTYINRDKMNIHRSMDTYLRTSVSKTKIQSSSGGGHSGGSSHRSSSGRSHGGGGHKF